MIIIVRALASLEKNSYGKTTRGGGGFLGEVLNWTTKNSFVSLESVLTRFSRQTVKGFLTFSRG